MKKFKRLLLIVLCLVFMPGIVNAASGSISVTGTSSAVVGNRVTVTVTLSSSTAIGSWQMALNYDKSYLQLVSSTAESGGTNMAGFAPTLSGVKSKSYTFVFKTLKTGNTRVSVSSYLAYDFNEEALSLTSSSKSIHIMTQAELEESYSKNNNLKNINVTVGEETYELDPEFDSDTLEYNVTVPTGTTSVHVDATRSDSTASVDGAGDVEVTEGLNTVPIVVTAQNGDEKTYTLIINVEDQNPIEVVIDGVTYTVVKSDTLLTAPATYSKATIDINGFEIPAFVNDATQYTLVGLKDEKGNISLYRYLDGNYSVYNELNSKSYTLVPIEFEEELDYIKTSVEINGIKVPAYQYSEDSNLYIINAVNLESGEEGLYLYDPASGAAIVFDESFINEANQTIEYYTYVIFAFAGALFLMLILIFALLHSTKKKQKKINQFIQKQEAKIEATRKLNDVVSEVKKVIQDEQPEKTDVIKVEEVKIEDDDKQEDSTLDEPTESVEEKKSDEKEEAKQEEVVQKSKKELKREKREAKKKAKEEKKKAKEAFFQDEVRDAEGKIEDEIKRIENDLDQDDTGVYDIFEDDRKKKKKKK